MFKKIAEIKFAKYKAISLEHYEDVEIESFIYIPGICIAGKKDLYIIIDSLEEKKVFINLKNKDYAGYVSCIFSFSLDLREIKKTKILDELGKFFNASLIKEHPNTYLYKILDPDGNTIIPTISYFKHIKNNSQFLMLSRIMPPQENSREQTGFYIDRLWQVEFDHDEFMKLMNE